MDRKSNTIVLSVSNMTCAGCERIIQTALNKLPGVVESRADYSKGIVRITCRGTVKQSHLITAVEEAGYNVLVQGSKPVKAGNKPGSSVGALRVSQLLAVGIIVFALYKIIDSTIGFNFIPEIKEGMGYGIIFVIGLLTSLHCISMCGGINLSQCIGYRKADAPNSKADNLIPGFLYNSGRVVSYTLIGGLVGALGSVISFSLRSKGIVVIAVGVFMIIMGLNMLGSFPLLRKIAPRLPASLTGSLFKKGSSKHGPFYVGLLNGLMPCGPLQTMQLYALGTGSFTKGALSMLVFSLGTVPLMFGIGAVSTLLSQRFNKKMLLASAVLVMFLGLIMITRGLSLTGTPVPAAAPVYGNVAQINGEEQVVRIDLEPNRYQPIVVQKGIPVKFIIHAERENITGCNNGIVIGQYGVQKSIEAGDNIIEFVPEETGSIGYSCWMGMIRSSITVVDNIDAVSTGKDTDPGSALPAGDGAPGCCSLGTS